MADSRNNKLNEEEAMNEEEAYFELCQIIAVAVETQDINLLKSRIEIWKSKYPWEKFSNKYKEKIRYILNTYYTEITRHIIAQIEQKRDFDSRKAYFKLYDIVNDTKDLKTLKSKIKAWEKEYPFDGFSQMYKNRIKKLTSEKSLAEHAINQEEAFADLLVISKSRCSFEELQEKIKTWEAEYSINDKYSIDDFINNKSEIKRLISEDYLKILSTDDFDLQSTACAELNVILNNPNDYYKMIRWANTYQHVEFDNFHKDLIITATSLHYPLNYLQTHSEPPININNDNLSFDDFKNIDIARKYATIRFISSIVNSSSLSSERQYEFNIIYRKSEKAERVFMIQDSIDNLLEKKKEYHSKAKSKATISKPESSSIVIPLYDTIISSNNMPKASTPNSIPSSEKDDNKPILDEAIDIEEKAGKEAIVEEVITPLPIIDTADNSIQASEKNDDKPILDEAIDIEEKTGKEAIVEEVITPLPIIDTVDNYIPSSGKDDNKPVLNEAIDIEEKARKEEITEEVITPLPTIDTVDNSIQSSEKDNDKPILDEAIDIEEKAEKGSNSIEEPIKKSDESSKAEVATGTKPKRRRKSNFAIFSLKDPKKEIPEKGLEDNTRDFPDHTINP